MLSMQMIIERKRTSSFNLEIRWFPTETGVEENLSPRTGVKYINLNFSNVKLVGACCSNVSAFHTYFRIFRDFYRTFIKRGITFRENENE